MQGSFTWTEGPILAAGTDRVDGVAVYPLHVPRQGTTDLKKNLLLRAADQAMYRAKGEGKDRVRVATLPGP